MCCENRSKKSVHVAEGRSRLHGWLQIPSENERMRLSPLFAAALIAASGAALAQEQAAPQPVSKAAFLSAMQGEFAEIDANKDGTVSTAEVDSARNKAVATLAARRAETAFAQLDTDKNGTLTPAEFAKLIKPADKLPPSPIMGFDANKDGRITTAEYKAGMEARFARLDANKDGVVTPAEARPAATSR
jgi:Ca2+-binding EF-hand superfamily protein